MKSNRSVLSILCGSILCVASSLAWCQIQTDIINDPQDPLQIVSVAMTPDGRNGPSRLTLRNEGSERIAAYVISIKTKLSNGKDRKQEILVDHKALGLTQPSDAAPAALATFEVPRHSSGGFAPLPTGITVTGFEVAVAYVELADGKVFGPDAARYKAQLCLERSIRRGERERLRKLNEQKGSAALIDELRRQ